MSIPSLTPPQRRFLKSLAHGLEPVMHVGREGVSDKVAGALDRAFANRELLKVQLLDGAESDKNEIAQQIACAAKACLVQLIGFRVVLYRPNPGLKNRIVLPD